MKLFIFMIAVAMTGCATIFNGSRDTITVTTNDKDAEIYLDGSLVGYGTAIFQVPKKGDHGLVVSKSGCGDAITTIPYSFDATSLLGVFIDLGLVSMLVVDGASTGAISKASQTNFILNPRCLFRPTNLAPSSGMKIPAT